MKKLVTVVTAAAALAGVQAIAATPAAAGGYCGYYGHYSYYGACCPRYYEVVSHYRPIVRRAVRTVGYRPVVARNYYRPCCR
jgi:hypothetical protein